MWKLLAFIQFIALARVVLRMAKSAGGHALAIPAIRQSMPTPETVVILPVLDEARRVRPCLESLTLIPDASRILVVDGGSRDGTGEIVREFAARDDRIELIGVPPIPDDWNGKVWGLQAGFEATSPATEWLLTVDADVVIHSQALSALLARAEQDGLDLLSLATQQRLRGSALGLLHPAMLTTLVYRFGIPGKTFEDVDSVQANGQCFLLRRAALGSAGGFESVRTSICEDVTLARRFVHLGYRVGFCEAGDLVVAEMYTNWRDAWFGWSRSLPTRDRYFGWRGWVGLIEVVLTQGLTIPSALAFTLAAPTRNRLLTTTSLALVATRLGVLVGVRRAYRNSHWSYWFSPILDLPVSIRLLASALQRSHVWRGRVLVRGE